MKSINAALLALIAVTSAHGVHPDERVNPADDWALYHMQEEHHISNFDPASFFSLHDFNNDGSWTPDEVRRIYGLDDESLKDTPADQKDKAVFDVFKIFDPYQSGVITRDQWTKKINEGKKLPDFGLGPGHHGDDEYEYEIHHFEKYHDENTREEDLIHPEDIEHFRKHDLLEDQADRIFREQQQTIVERNIPRKFLRRP
ncbi:putative calcium-binding protein [Cladophialophora carrionii]|uniref:Putative calcium-binding protein n=1 Tax=Cladophialophora carrionii TaxID=86049 RepID=A0A1C1C7R5_9EURO|nr:putative calcium-binding protein [Cladophialophora carrionii]